MGFGDLADPETRRIARAHIADGWDPGEKVLAALDQADAEAAQRDRRKSILEANGDEAALEKLVTKPQTPDTSDSTKSIEQKNRELNAQLAAIKGRQDAQARGASQLADLTAAGKAQKAVEAPAAPPVEPALPESHWMRVAGDAIGDAVAGGAKAVGRAALAAVDDPERHEWWDAPGSTTPGPPPVPPTAIAASAPPPAAPMPAGVPPGPMGPAVNAVGALAQGAALPPQKTVQVGNAAQIQVPNAQLIQGHGVAPPREAALIDGKPPVDPMANAQAAAAPQVQTPAAAPAKSPVDELAAAQAAGNRQADLMGALGLVSKNAASFAGAEPNMDWYARQVAAGKMPVEQYLQREMELEKKKAAAEQAVAKDPNSPQSKLKQKALVDVTGGLFTPEQAATLSAHDIDTAQDLVKLHAESREKAAAVKAEAARAAAHEAAETQRERERSSMELKKATIEHEGKNGPKPVPESEAAKIVNQQQALKALDQLEKLHGQIGITGMNPIGNSAYNRYGDALNGLSSAIAAGMMPQGRETPNMMEEIKRSLPGGGDNTKRAKLAFERAREQIRANAAAQISALQAAGYSPAQIAELSRQGGGSGLNATPPAPAPGMVRIRDQKSGRTGWARPDAIPAGAEVFNAGS